MEEQLQQAINEAGRYGYRLVSWKVDEYPRHSRSRTWYIVAAVLGVALIIYAVATANFMFAVIILMLGVVTLLSTFKEPEKIEVILTTTGLALGNSFFEYRNIKDFSIVYHLPETKLLYVSLTSVLHPLLSIPLEEMDPNEVRETLLPYCLENLNRTEEGLTDTLRRLYKL